MKEKIIISNFFKKSFFETENYMLTLSYDTSIVVFVKPSTIVET
jgi:hypothetical protein